MSELRAVVSAVHELRNADEAFVSATVVRVHGSAYRRASARMIATHERWIAGSISGGCLEREVITRGFWRTREVPAVLVTYNDAEDALEERSGPGCEGVIEMLVERHESSSAREADWFQLAERCLREDIVGVAATVFRSSRSDVPVGTRLTLCGDAYACTRDSAWVRTELLPEARVALTSESPQYVVQRAGGEIEALIERVVPPVHLFVFGAGHDATPLVDLAKQIGWTVSVWDALPRVSTRERFRRADHYLTDSLEHAVARLDRAVQPAAVVMGHHLEQDQRSLAALLPSRAQYIGVLGPRRRSNAMLAECELDLERLSRVYAPVGLRIGAETPAEIALAVVAEAQAVLTGSDAHSLRNEAGAIHAVTPLVSPKLIVQ